MTRIKELPVTFGNHEVMLQGKILFPAESSTDSPVPGAVLCHGFGANQKAVESSARIITNQGVATFIFDFRGHGSSGGAVDGRMADDIVDAWDILKQFPEIDKSRMGIIGHSLGAMSAIMAAEKVENPRALVALSCPPQVDPEIDNEMYNGIPADFGQWGSKYNKIMEFPRQGAFPWLKGISAPLSRLWMYLFRYRVRVDLKKFFEITKQIKMAEALGKLDHCSKLFVFCEGDNITPYNKSVLVYESACEPRTKILAKGGFHTTPLLRGNLRSQWTNWVVATLTN